MVRLAADRQEVLSLFFLADSSFVLAMREKAKGNDDAALLLGSGVVSYTGWVIATVIGYAIGHKMGDPRIYGLDTILVLFCASAVAFMWRGPAQLAPAAGAAAAAIAVDRDGRRPVGHRGGGRDRRADRSGDA